MTIPNVLANRYASDEMVAIWSPEAKVVAERRLWLAVLKAQVALGTEGAAVPSSVLDDYERVLDDVDLSSSSWTASRPFASKADPSCTERLQVP